jgi:2-polyprenyl-6-methoxyphenol hydroxylase-like FAD-dependent oxidoreductase
MRQVLIVGAGPTGLTLACLLAQKGIDVQIVDRAAPRSVFESRAIGTHARTMRIFAELGVLDEMLARGLKWSEFNFWANKRQIGRLSFAGIDKQFDFALILPQAETERILRERLAASGLPVEHETELIDFIDSGNCIRTRLRHGGIESEIETAFLVGADGAKSVVRRILNLDFVGRRLQGSYLMDCAVDWYGSPLLEGNTFFADGWRLIVGQLPGERWRIVANLPAADSRLQPETPSIELMQQFVDELSLSLRIRDFSWASRFWLSVRRVDKMRVGRVFLAGDAAHNVCPNAGQGMNAGIHDAVVLARCLNAFFAKGENALDFYERLRLPVVKNLITASEQTERLMTLRNSFAARLRNAILPIVSRSNFLQQKVARQIAGLNVNLGG